MDLDGFDAAISIINVPKKPISFESVNYIVRVMKDFVMGFDSSIC